MKLFYINKRDTENGNCITFSAVLKEKGQVNPLRIERATWCTMRPAEQSPNGPYGHLVWIIHLFWPIKISGTSLKQFSSRVHTWCGLQGVNGNSCRDQEGFCLQGLIHTQTKKPAEAFPDDLLPCQGEKGIAICEMGFKKKIVSSASHSVSNYVSWELMILWSVTVLLCVP